MISGNKAFMTQGPFVTTITDGIPAIRKNGQGNSE